MPSMPFALSALYSYISDRRIHYLKGAPETISGAPFCCEQYGFGFNIQDTWPDDSGNGPQAAHFQWVKYNL